LRGIPARRSSYIGVLRKTAGGRVHVDIEEPVHRIGGRGGVSGGYQSIGGRRGHSPAGRIVRVARQGLFNDNFNSFKLGTKWEVPNYLNQANNVCNNPTTTPCTFLGPPNVNLGIGFNGLRMTSAQSNLQETGIGTIESFKLQNGTVEVDVLTGKASDPALTLPPGTNRSNIDGVIGVELINKTTGAAVFVQLYAGTYGTNQTFIMRIPEYINSPGPNDWQFNQYYRVLFTSKGANMAILFQNRYGQTLISDPLPISFAALGPFNVLLLQNMGTPGAPYYNDVFVQHLKVSRSGG
jgi:hypothetical protein